MVKEIPGLFAGTRYSGEGQHRSRKRGAFHRGVPWLPGRRQLPLPPARPGAAVSPEPPQLPAATPLPCSQLWHQPGVPRCVPAAREGSHRRPASQSFLSGYLAWTNALGRKADAIPAAAEPAVSSSRGWHEGPLPNEALSCRTRRRDPPAKRLGCSWRSRRPPPQTCLQGQPVTWGGLVCDPPPPAPLPNTGAASGQRGSGLLVLEDPANRCGSGAGCRTPAPRFFSRNGSGN